MHRISALLAVAFVVVGSTLAQQSSDTCSNSTLTDPFYYKYYDPLRISEGIVCERDVAGDNDSCPLESWAYISYGTRFNISFTDDEQRDAMIDFLALGNDDPIALARNNISGIIANETLQVPLGVSAYVEFVEEYSCMASFVSGCQGALAAFDSTYIEYCYPLYNTGSGTIPMFYSEKSLNRVDAETARGMTDHPYGTDDEGLGVRQPCRVADNGCFTMDESNGVVDDDNNQNSNATDSSNDTESSDETTVIQQEGNGASTLGASAIVLGAVGAAFVLGPL